MRSFADNYPPGYNENMDPASQEPTLLESIEEHLARRGMFDSCMEENGPSPSPGDHLLYAAWERLGELETRLYELTNVKEITLRHVLENYPESRDWLKAHVIDEIVAGGFPYAFRDKEFFKTILANAEKTHPRVKPDTTNKSPLYGTF